MRVPSNQLAVEMIEDLGNCEVAFVRRHLGVKKHLQQQVAEFFSQVRKVAALDCVEDLIGLFEGVFANRVEGLFAVPGASTGRPQPRHNRRRLLEQGRSPRRISQQIICGSLCLCTVRRGFHVLPF